MRTVKILVPVLFLAGCVSLSLAAQQPAPSPSPSTPQSMPAQPNPGTQPDSPSAQPRDTKATAVPVPSTASAPEAGNDQLRPVTGELEKKLDSKNAKPGDPVILKTTEKATTADGVVIPKGSRIIGHVIDVQAHSKETPNARLTIQFDQAEIKGGQTLPIQTVMESVSPPTTTVHPTDTMNSMGSAPVANPSGTRGAMTGSPMGASPMGAPSAGGAASAPSAGGGVPTMSAGTEAQAANAAPKTGTVVARQGNVAIKTTAVPGVLLATNANGKPFSNASGALLGAKRNVHLDGGTEVVLAVMETPQKPGTR